MIMKRYICSSLGSTTLDSTLQMKESAGIVATLVNAVDIGLSAFSKGDAYGDGKSQFSALVWKRQECIQVALCLFRPSLP